MRSQIVRSIQISEKGIPDLTKIPPGLPFFVQLHKDAYIFDVDSEFEKQTRLIKTPKGEGILPPKEYGYIYYLADHDQIELEARKFVMVESGMEFKCEENEGVVFLGSFKLLQKGLTIHLFEILNISEQVAS